MRRGRVDPRRRSGLGTAPARGRIDGDAEPRRGRGGVQEVPATSAPIAVTGTPGPTCSPRTRVYVEVQYGTFHGREAIRKWITTVMAGVPDMYFPPPTWRLIDGDQVCFCIDNAYPESEGSERAADRLPDRDLPQVPRRPVVSRGGHLRRARQPRGARRLPRRRRQRRAGDGARMTASTSPTASTSSPRPAPTREALVQGAHRLHLASARAPRPQRRGLDDRRAARRARARSRSTPTTIPPTWRACTPR